ncbi:MAG: hypothetical protein OXL38_03170 [Gammaproteobacteria bacterium]|nr:hypothetical protein [Gammaproteobacteria bacterium]
MTVPRTARVVALAGAAALVVGLLWLDGNRAGPAGAMARCNLLLSRVDEPAAEVLVVGSSRSGVALDPVAMQGILTAELGSAPVRVDRFALGHVSIRAMSGLLGNYLENRGPPDVVVLEIMFMTERGVDRLARRGLALAPEAYVYRRDVNLLDFGQLLVQGAVAKPFTVAESVADLWSHRLRGMLLRAGALVYQALRDPQEVWELAACKREDWTREPGWPADFAFSYGEFEPDAPLDDLIEALEADVAGEARLREPASWQANAPAGIAYPYDPDAAYRRGEVALLHSMIESVLEAGAEVELLPLPLHGYDLDHAELRRLIAGYGGKVRLFDLYGAVGVDFGPLWYDDGHVAISPVGRLTTALMARRLLRSAALFARPPAPDG